MMHFKPVFTTQLKPPKSSGKSQQLHCTPSSGERKVNTERTLTRAGLYEQDMNLIGVEIYGFFSDIISV
jgi:hypothetical protein